MVSLSFISIELFYEVQKCLTLIIKHMYFLSAFFHPYCFLLTYSCIDYLSFHFFSMSPTDVVRNWEGFLWKIATHHWEQDFSIPLIEIMLTVDRGRFKSTSCVWSTLCIDQATNQKQSERNQPRFEFLRNRLI